MPQKVRIDKWLWSVRIFKSRTLATQACKAGKVKIANQPVKPSYSLDLDEIVDVRKNGFDLVFQVKKLIQKRVGAPLAQECYVDLTPDEELNKYRDWFVGKASVERRERGSGRPTKKERREIEQFKDEFFGYDEFDE